MIAGEKLKGSNGKEVMLFPLPTLNISQGEGGNYSHAGTLNIDFVGDTTQAPYYAPCKCQCVYAGGVDNIRAFNSLEPVNLPDGSVDYVCFLFMHDDNPVATFGSIFEQGDLIGHTGNAGTSTSDHVHMNTARGHYQGMEQVPPDNQWQLINSSHIYDTCYVNDTTIINGYEYNWKIYQGGIKPLLKNNKFNFILFGYYSKKKRRW